MDLTAQTVHSVPGAPLTQTDVSVVQDEGLLTNVQAPSLTRVLNPTAIALDNAAGTGAPFDKRDQVYKIYQRWSEKSTVINGAVSAGAELIRISLNPSTLPARLLDWVSFHQSCIPAIDVVFVIGGAAGTISWLTLGWLADDEAPASLDLLQQVSCEHINMNNTAIMRFTLNDNRKNGLYRSIPHDPEKWPCMVLMVNHPALNVQRNDDVNYPLDVYVRFAPNAVFMEPFNTLGSDGGDLGSVLDLSYYLKYDQNDIVIGGSSVNNVETELSTYPDCGWSTGEFVPLFQERNLLCCRTIHTNTYKETFYTRVGETVPVEDLNEAWKKLAPEIGDAIGYVLPDRMAFAFGKVPNRLVQAKWDGKQEFPLNGMGASVYSIPPLECMAGSVHYVADQIFVYEYGAVIILRIDTSARSNTFVEYKCRSDEFYLTDFFPFYSPNAPPGQHVIYNEAKGDKVYRFAIGNGIRINDDGTIWPLSFKREPTPVNRFYTFTFVQTGNTAPSSSLPTGLKTISLVRPGTTTTVKGDASFWPVWAPDISGAIKILEAWRKRAGSVWIAMEFEINAEPIGTLVYAEGVMACRFATPRQIAVSQPKSMVMRNIRAIANPSSIQTLNTEKFSSWEKSKLAEQLGLNLDVPNTKPRFREIPMQREAAGMAIGGVAGMTNGIYDFFQQWQRNKWLMKYQEAQQKAMLDLQNARDNNAFENQRRLKDQDLKNRMILLGVNAPTSNNVQVSDFGTNTPQTSFSDASTGPMPSPLSNPIDSSSVATSTDIRGEFMNAPSHNADNEFGRRPAWMNGAVPTPFTQVKNLDSGKSQDAGPSSTTTDEEPLPGYSAFDPTSIGLPPEELEEFIRGEPKRTAMRLKPDVDSASSQPPPPPPMPERLLQPPTPLQNFNRGDIVRQPIRRIAPAPTSPVELPSLEQPSYSNADMPYDFLRYDPLRVGRRDFSNSQYSAQQFNRNDPTRKGFYGYSESNYGPQNFDREAKARQPFRAPFSNQFPPQNFRRDDPIRQPVRDLRGISFGSQAQIQTQSSPMTNERLL